MLSAIFWKDVAFSLASVFQQMAWLFVFLLFNQDVFT